MAKKHTQSNSAAEFTMKHRAVCNNCSYKGSWSADINLAYKDADTHQTQPGNNKHVVNIVTEQTLSMVYQKPG